MQRSLAIRDGTTGDTRGTSSGAACHQMARSCHHREKSPSFIASKLVQNKGQPISHSTHVGFSGAGISSPRDFAAFWLLLPPRSPPVTGVGQFGPDPDSLPYVRRSGVDRSQHTPSSIEPHFGKITEGHGKASSHKHR